MEILSLFLLSGLVGLVLGWLLARFLRVWAGWALVGVLAVAVAGFILAGQSAQGMEGLGHVVVAMVLAAPAMLGAAIGTLAGGWMRQRARIRLRK